MSKFSKRVDRLADPDNRVPDLKRVKDLERQEREREQRKALERDRKRGKK